MVLLVLCGAYSHVLAQNALIDTAQHKKDNVHSVSISKDTTHAFLIKFTKKRVILEETDIVTNVIAAHNFTEDAVTFTLKISSPFGWNTITDEEVKYTLKSGDSTFIPIRVIPLTTKGGEEYIINVYAFGSPNNAQLANDYFFTGSQVMARWDVNVIPSRKIYFLNNCDTATFALNISNSGNQIEDLALTLKNFQNKTMLLDSTGKIIHTNYFNVVIKPGQDSTLTFKAKYIGDPLNFQYRDIEEYIPANTVNQQNFSVWATTQETRQTDSLGGYPRGKQIDFAKLNDITIANPYGGQVFPLTADLNAYNILGTQPVMNLMLYGNTILNNGARLFYNGSMFYSSYFLSNQILTSSSIYGGYYDTRGDDIQAGNIGLAAPSGLAVGGIGVKGDYVVNKQNLVGGSVIEGFRNDALGLEAWYRHKFDGGIPLIGNEIFATTAEYTQNYITHSTDYSLSEAGGLILAKNQTLGFTVTGIEKIYTNTTFFGNIVSLNYGGAFFNNRLHQADYFSHADYDTSVVLRNVMSMGNNSTYKLSNKWQLLLQNNLNIYQTPYYKITPQDLIFTNYLYAINYSGNTGLASYVFYNRYNSTNILLAYFGGGERYNYFNLKNNALVSATVQGGYNHLLNYPNIKDYFTLQPSLLLRYHTTTFRAFYDYGPNGIPNLATFIGSSPYPQEFSLSLDKQYQFPGRHFVFDAILTYSNYNVFADNSFTLSPELYYFTNSGWRFKAGLDYSFNSTNLGQNGFYYAYANENNENTGPVVTDNIYINLGIKKQFGIPVPRKWAKYFYKTVTFIAFLDLNGDGKKGPNEIPVDNVVVHITNGPDTYEALTGDDGIAKILNLKIGSYSLTTIPLQNMKEWFDNSPDSINSSIKDTIYVPFVKGVKVMGAVVYHPGKYSVTPTIDLHNIQITATDIISGKPYDVLTNAQGEYILYVPIGKYTLSMNEDWLDDRFTVAQNNFTLDLLHGMNNIYQSFYISEKAAKVEIKQFGAPAPTPSNNTTTHPPDDVPHH